jgi:putative ABC transport system permease protein
MSGGQTGGAAGVAVVPTNAEGRRPRAAGNSGFGLLALARAGLTRRKSRAAIAAVALSLGAAMTVGLVGVYRGVRLGISREFRQYGANVIVTPPDSGAVIPARALADLRAAAGASASATGVLYVVATARPEIPSGANDGSATASAAEARTIAVAGADWAELRAMNPSWRVQALPRDSYANGNAASLPAAAIGVIAARNLNVNRGGVIRVEFGGRSARLRADKMIETGGSKDNQIVAPLPAIEALTGLDGFSTIEVRADGGTQNVEAVVARLRSAAAGLNVSPVRQIARGEGAVILKTHSLLEGMTALILFTIGLCVSAVLAGMAIERRRDVAVMKALGAEDRTIYISFLIEAAALGVLGGTIGAAAGVIMAAFIGRRAFDTLLSPTPGVLIAAVLLTVVVACAAALAPVSVVHRVTPATILKGQ